MVDAEYKADLLVYVVTIVAGLLAIVADYATCVRAVRFDLDKIFLPLISIDSWSFIMHNFDTTIFYFTWSSITWSSIASLRIIIFLPH